MIPVCLRLRLNVDHQFQDNTLTNTGSMASFYTGNRRPRYNKTP